MWHNISFSAAIARQRGTLFPWSAVFLGIGVAIYFNVRFEPGQTVLFGLAVVTVLCCLGARFGSETMSPMLAAAAFIAFGVLLSAAHAHWSRAPVLGYRYYGPVEGFVVAVDRSQSGKIRMTLDRVVLKNTSPARTPERVRISLHGDADPDAPSKYEGFVALMPEPGQHLVLTANLSPPPGPAEPGGFDFRRFAWFKKLGAIGYSRTPVLEIGPTETHGFWLRIERLRGHLSTLVRARIPGEAGAFAAAITTGDRSAMSRETTDMLRASNLSHLLAISGLHMGLMTGFVFACLRFAFILIPGAGLHWPVRKLAAIGALMTGAVYLALSGGNVATVRAFIMISVLFVAVLLGRRALTLNAVALAGLIVLLINPEALVGPGFQMSFAATTALVFVFGTLRPHAGQSRIPARLRPVFAVFASSFIAGAATAPVAAAHFNQVAQYGLLANVLSVPVMGMIVVPAGVMALLLEPVGLGWVGFWVMEMGVRWILWVADFVSGLDGAVWKVITPQKTVLPLIFLGALWYALWKGAARRIGPVVIIIGMILWGQTDRPAVIVAQSGRTMGVMTPDGRVISKPRGDGFAVRNWLENDGDPALQQEAASRDGLVNDAGVTVFHLGGETIAILAGRGAKDRIIDLWRDGVWLFYGGKIDVLPDVSGCKFFTERRLRHTGSLAIYPNPDGGGGIHVVTAAELAGNRLWVPRRRARRQDQ
ncbi:ComEC/Rec2 family competence protein [Halocynthiibacter namhaensis]|uniref:ComEC/Rec2 family competence protein n=1 Tax=Halocynthiibacter namhaensis TaxID=1290553 RepID=UPI00057903DD|nr:ComEC/Rec2 family competence protein [Halocynthiibacter namhaensis]